MKKKILIIGSGAAGLSCAVSCAEKGNIVTVVSPYFSERSQSVMAAGGINAALDTKGEGDSVECHINDTLKGGCYIADYDEVERLCKNAPETLRWLEAFGTVFTRDKNGKLDLRAFGGQTHRRTAFAGACTGKQIITALTSEARKYECSGEIKRLIGLQFHSALIKDGRCYGALLFDEASRRTEAFYADAVVMATGGQNLLFGKTTGTVLCDGYAQGKLFEQGAALKNLEFIQYHPTTIETPMKRMLITEAVRGEGGRLFYIDGNRKVYFMEDKYGEKGNLMPRDIVSKCIYDAPSQVYLDITFLGRSKIQSRLSEVDELCGKYAGIDIAKECIPVYPSVHFFMGGLAVNINHRTNIDRLYAAGECASIYHGANRLGGNSLLAAVHGGRTAAADIDETISECTAPDFSAYINEQTNNIFSVVSGKSLFPVAYLRNEIAKIMNDDLGITRTEEKLKSGLDGIGYYLSINDKLRFDASISPYQAYSVGGMLLLSYAVLKSALERRETRGAHIREDFPQSSDDFKAHSEANYNTENSTVSINFVKSK